MSFFSVAGVANLVSSTVLSRDSEPLAKAAETWTSSSRAWAAATQRRAFQFEMPAIPESHCAMLRHPS